MLASLAVAACSAENRGVSVTCDSDGQCLTRLCVQGACRLPCTTDCDCADDSACQNLGGRFVCVQGPHSCTLPHDAGPVVRDAGPRIDANHVGALYCGVGYAGDNPTACKCDSLDVGSGNSTSCSRSTSGQSCCADLEWPLIGSRCECGTPRCHHHDFGTFDRCDCDWNNGSGGTVVTSCSPQPGAVCCIAGRDCSCQSDVTFCDPAHGWDRQVPSCNASMIACTGTTPSSCR